jgi:hypothetical protein
MKDTRTYWDETKNNFSSEGHMCKQEGPIKNQLMADHSAVSMAGCQDTAILLQHRI